MTHALMSKRNRAQGGRAVPQGLTSPVQGAAAAPRLSDQWPREGRKGQQSPYECSAQPAPTPHTEIAEACRHCWLLRVGLWGPGQRLPVRFAQSPFRPEVMASSSHQTKQRRHLFLRAGAQPPEVKWVTSPPGTLCPASPPSPSGGSLLPQGLAVFSFHPSELIEAVCLQGFSEWIPVTLRHTERVATQPLWALDPQ